MRGLRTGPTRVAWRPCAMRALRWGPIRHVCRDCGAEEKNHTGGCCARCSLGEVLRRLSADGDPPAIARLEASRGAVGGGPQPWTTLKWMGCKVRTRRPRRGARAARRRGPRADPRVLALA